MRPRFATLCVLGAALTLAATAAAQDTTKTKPRARSTTRIPIQKESPGEVVSRVDTVTVYRTDTLNVYRTDTVRTSTMLHDTVRVEVPLMPAPIRHIGGLYFGLGGGAAFPAANENFGEKPGPRVEALVGYDPADFPIGLRIRGGYSTYEPQSAVASLTAGNSAKLWDVSGDLKLRAPSLQPWGLHFSTYGIAGVTWNRYKNLIETASNGAIRVGNLSAQPNAAAPGTYSYSGGTPAAGYDNAWYNKMGWNVGGGAQFGWKDLSVYGEMRYSRFNDLMAVNMAPLVFGVTLF